MLNLRMAIFLLIVAGITLYDKLDRLAYLMW
jgi:hypothetical protein